MLLTLNLFLLQILQYNGFNQLILLFGLLFILLVYQILIHNQPEGINQSQIAIPIFKPLIYELFLLIK